MKISIITSVFNNEATIAHAIESVISQTYDDIEYIVIDGASNDGTLDIIKEYAKHIDVFQSEPDDGIYDGLNKGISLASGDVIGFLHSDDYYHHDGVINLVAETFKNNNTDSVYGDLQYVKKNERLSVVRHWRSGEFSQDKLSRGWMPPHPTFFVKREIYNDAGVFDTNFKVAADYDLILRFLGKYRISSHYIPEVLISMRTGGESNRNLKSILQKSIDDYRAMKKNSVGNVYSLFNKNFMKIPQFFK